jgi:hypothetical protein
MERQKETTPEKEGREENREKRQHEAERRKKWRNVRGKDRIG